MAQAGDLSQSEGGPDSKTSQPDEHTVAETAGSEAKLDSDAKPEEGDELAKATAHHEEQKGADEPSSGSGTPDTSTKLQESGLDSETSKPDEHTVDEAADSEAKLDSNAKQGQGDESLKATAHKEGQNTITEPAPGSTTLDTLTKLPGK